MSQNTLSLISDIKTLKQQIEYVLENQPETRNSDKLLTISIWRIFHKDLLCHVDRVGETVPIYNILDLPSESSVTRIRAMVQNRDKRFLPTDIDIAIERGWRESDWKIAMGYHVEDPAQLTFTEM